MSINLSNINEQVKLPEYYNDYNYYSLLDDLHDNPDEKITKKDLCAVGFSYHGKKACAFTVYPEDDNTSFNNITEYKCIFRSKEPIVKTSYDEDDFGYDDKGKPILSTNSARRPLSTIIDSHDFPEHWSMSVPKSNDEIIYCKNHAYSYTEQENESVAYKDTKYYQGSRTEIQSECRGHILNPEFIEISHDTILKYYNISIGDYNWLVDVLNKRIREKNKSPKYAWNNNNTGIERLNTAQSGNIIKELKELNNILGKMQPEGNDKKTSNRKHDHWIYHSDKLSNETNLIETELITNVFEVVANNEIQDCICYSDCNGYSVCWCYGNCNYY